MNFLIINGPNLNMLGIREPSIYGEMTYDTICDLVFRYAKDKGHNAVIFQSNYEGELVTKIQEAYGKFDGIIINPAAYTHTSIAILDALKAVNIPTVEVHLSDVKSREDFRKISYVSLYAKQTIAGLGMRGYLEAIDYLENFLKS